jgi:mannose-6-phosphate isomerase-like protein (cupin superfamily)
MTTTSTKRENAERTIYHPIQRDTVTFLETAKETNGERLLIRIELEAGGGNGLHRHAAFTETFAVESGVLHVEVGSETHRLGPGQSASVPPEVPHRFFSTGEAAVFTVEISPPGRFEECLRVGYGLARDGLTDAHGYPLDPFYSALLLEMADSYPPDGPIPVLRLANSVLASVGRLLGKDRDLERYL